MRQCDAKDPDMEGPLLAFLSAIVSNIVSVSHSPSPAKPTHFSFVSMFLLQCESILDFFLIDLKQARAAAQRVPEGASPRKTLQSDAQATRNTTADSDNAPGMQFQLFTMLIELMESPHEQISARASQVNRLSLSLCFYPFVYHFVFHFVFHLSFTLSSLCVLLCLHFVYHFVYHFVFRFVFHFVYHFVYQFCFSPFFLSPFSLTHSHTHTFSLSFLSFLRYRKFFDWHRCKPRLWLPLHETQPSVI